MKQPFTSLANLCSVVARRTFGYQRKSCPLPQNQLVEDSRPIQQAAEGGQAVCHRNSMMKPKRSSLVLAIAAVSVAAAMYGMGVYRDAHPENEVARLASLVQLRPGMTVAEIGAGEGRMTLLVAGGIGPSGRVYSTEIEQASVEAIQAAADSSGLSNVIAVQGMPDDASLPAACCEVIFMSKVYHHFTDPAEMNASLFHALRPGGRLAVIDFEPRFWRFWLTLPAGVPENRAGHGMPIDVLRDELKAAGFQITEVDDAWWSWPERRFCVLAQKPVTTPGSSEVELTLATKGLAARPR